MASLIGSNWRDIVAISSLSIEAGLYLWLAILIWIGPLVAIWLLERRMRRRVTEDIGRKATESDLGSLKVWMEVDEAEKRKGFGEDRALVPKPVDDYVQLVDYERLMRSESREDQSIPLMDIPVRLFRINHDSKTK